MLHEQGAAQDGLHVSYRRDRGASLEYTCTQRGVDQTHAARWPHGRGFAQLVLAANRTETSLLCKAPPDSNSMREEEVGGDEPDSGCVAGSAGSALYPLGSRRGCANRLFARAMSIVPGRKKAAAGGAVRSSSFGRRKGGASTNASPVNSRRSQSTPAERYSPRVDTSLPWRPPQTRCSGGVGRVAKPAPTLALCTSLARWAPPRPLQCRSMEVCDAPGVE